MAARKKTDEQQPDERMGDRPGHLAELCDRCGTEEHGGGAPAPSATSFGCEHGTWVFPAAEEQTDPVAAVDGALADRDARIAELEQQLAAATSAPPAE